MHERPRSRCGKDVEVLHLTRGCERLHKATASLTKRGVPCAACQLLPVVELARDGVETAQRHICAIPCTLGAVACAAEIQRESGLCVRELSG